MAKAKKNTVVRSLHDLGLAAWFGGSVMGAVGVNGAADDVRDPNDRMRVAARGWARWAPVNAVAIGAHAVGALGLLAANRQRSRYQAGVRAGNITKVVLTLAAAGATAYSGVLGRRTEMAQGAPAEGSVSPSSGTPAEAADAQRQLKLLQWAIPVLTGSLVVIGAVQGEQQKPEVQADGLLAGVGKRLRSS